MREFFTELLSRVTEISARRAAWIVTVAFLLTGMLSYYTAAHFSINTNTVDMLDPRLPFRQATRELEQAFPQLRNNIIIVIESDTAVRANDLGHQLAEALKQDTRHFKSIFEPTGGPFFAHNGLLYLDTPALEELADTLAKAQPMLGTLATDMNLRGLLTVLGRALKETLQPDDEKILLPIFDSLSDTIEHQLANRPSRISWEAKLFSDAMPAEAGKRGFVLVQPNLEFSELESARGPVEAIRQAAARLSLDPSRDRIRLTGEAVMADEELASVAQGAKFSSLLSFGLVCLLTVAGLRSPRHVITIVLTLIVGLICTGAFATAAIGALNLISINFAVLFIGMGVDFGIQVGLRYKEEIYHGFSHPDAVLRTGAGLGGALTLAAVAAAVSFFSFVPTSYRGLAELGIIAGVGMGIALIANLTLLPALLTLIPRFLDWQSPASARTPGVLSTVLTRYQRMILWTGLLAMIGSAALLPWVRFDFNPLNMKDPTAESVATFQDLLADPNTTPYTISVIAPDLSSVAALAEKVAQLKSVDKAITLQSFVPEDQEEKLAIIDGINLSLGPALEAGPAGQPAGLKDEMAAVAEFKRALQSAGRTAFSPAAVASVERLTAALDRLQSAPDWPEPALKALRQSIISDLPESLDQLRQLLNPSRITLEKLPQEFKERYVSADGRARAEIFPREDVRDNEALRRFVREVQGLAPNATDSAVELVEGGDAVIEASLHATGLALLTTAVLLLAVLRRLIDTGLILIPLVFSLLLTAASSVVFGIPFDLANIIALPLLLGLSNAYGIYLILRLRAEGTLDKLLRTNTPRAIFFSALTEIISFGTLAVSPHRGMSGMGILVTVSLSFAVLSTLFLLPAILIYSEGRNSSPDAHDLVEDLLGKRD